MNAKNIRPHASMITLGDIYYILFRHKWKILVLGAIGVIGALVLPLAWPQSYTSEAKLLIKYVVETGAPTGPNGDGSRISYTDVAGRNIINTELQILTSLDLAQEVATNVGPAKILGHDGDVHVAAGVIDNNLFVEPLLSSDVIRITFRHKDPAVAQLVLTQVIKTYLERHTKIRQPGGDDDAMSAQIDDLKARFKDTEDALNAIKTNLNIVSFEDSRKLFADRMETIQSQIFEAQAELAEHQATYTELKKRDGVDPNAATHGQRGNEHGNTNGDSCGNQWRGAGNAAARIRWRKLPPANTVKTVSPETVEDYQRVCERVKTLRDDEKDLLKTFLPENLRVREKREQIAAAEKQKKQLEQDNAGLLVTAVAVAAAADTKSAGDTAVINRVNDESARIAALQSRIQTLTKQLAYIKGRASALDGKQEDIVQLERTRKIEEENYNYFLTSQLNNSIDQNYGAKSSNINVIQSPQTPYMDTGKLKKARIGLGLAGILLGLGLAFLIEMYIDRTVKRPADIEAKMGVPLFLSIPYRNGNGNGKQRLLPEAPKTVMALRSDATGRAIILNGTKTTIGRDAGSTVRLDDDSISEHHCEISSRNGEVTVKDLGSAMGTFVDGQQIMEATLKPEQTLRIGKVEFRVESQERIKAVEVSKKSAAAMPPWDPRHALRPFYDTLRDRLITYFEVKNLTHNPKLVALTGCGDHAGVSSTAAGLAAALSETGEGNVLLVDMNVERGAAHHFYKGHLSCGIDEALKKDKRHEARVQDNLYVVTENNSDEDSLPRVLPKRFMNLVPKLKASDYDYIIFDMPPMSQISITPRLARFMDMVMVVVESEKTDREVVQRAVNMLTETRANVGVVLNKRKRYVPKQLQQEL